MFDTTPDSGREKLDFAEEVQSAFTFLVTDYGFRLVRTEPTFVRYESPDVCVNIYHGRASFEIGVEIGRFINSVAHEERPFSLSEIIELIPALVDKDTAY